MTREELNVIDVQEILARDVAGDCWERCCDYVKSVDGVIVCSPAEWMSRREEHEILDFIAASKTAVPKMRDEIKRLWVKAEQLMYLVETDGRLSGPNRDHDLYETLINLAHEMLPDKD